MTDVQLVSLGFHDTGFGCIVRKCEISVWIVRLPRSFSMPGFEVHLFHGSPAGAFWRNSRPLAVCSTEAAAREVAEQIFGIADSGKFANLVDY